MLTLKKIEQTELEGEMRFVQPFVGSLASYV